MKNLPLSSASGEAGNAPVPTAPGARIGLLVERHSVLILALLLLIAVPALTGAFRLGLFAKYLSFAFCAVGLVLTWGYGGILSLGQGIFFGLGSYMMAMYMKLEASANDPAAAVFGGGATVPDFMTWNSIDKLPWWWVPFEHAWFTLPMIIVLPALVAFVLGYANFRKRVGGVYFSIVTLALASIMSIVIIGQQGYTGGVNGITNLPTFMGYSVQSNTATLVMYYVTVVLLLCAVLAGRFILKSRLGKVLIAIRDREDRIRFSGYDPALFKGFIFAVAAMYSAIGGAMFTLQVGFASPSVCGIVPSIEMVIYAAVGGRLSLVGAVYGTVIIGAAKSYLSENFVGFWVYFIGALFIFVPMLLPKGLAGVVDWLREQRPARRNGAPGAQEATQ
ncbi:urea ABC transporter permease subunit UrtC [Paraburkholderia unamae]|uniref:Amino acid/amide ABC transporter membrane protein 2 (HAAT family) n=1 Tax=Paraburkholderia unamae TaxID=219649 RepID=A0ABX5KJN1_9BURK|nr:urea ABC transporter permease subunit UrtC [Paraburkholderia unamae]PVX81739.1 amino acid/amide ABC transporter membrane protein 2 (HAAT family) [Paraburkholderia unamae]RAR62548.1 amino acid/amide ABC transporter membrane protein 2 (HAAT family) [Paraburkholderia unamae]CAG9265438.1 Urea ABC transporter, permease protein UrtC [Paraburkholderia unamae]